MPRRGEGPIGQIRRPDPELWLEVRLEATRRRVPMNVVFNEIVREWLERRAASPAPANGRMPAAVTT